MPYSTGTYVTNYEDEEKCGSDADWEKRNCPIGCSNSHRWNMGCGNCEEMYDIAKNKPPCKPYLDEIKERTKQVLPDKCVSDMWMPRGVDEYGRKKMVLVNAVPFETIELKMNSIIEHAIRLEHELELTQNERDKYKRLAYEKCCKRTIDNQECGGIRVNGKVCITDGTFCQYVIDKVNKELKELK